MLLSMALAAVLCLAVMIGTVPGMETAAMAEGQSDASRYTVEFSRDDLEYVLPGDSSVAMSEILSALGLTGEVTAVGISDISLFSASNETGEWIVTAHQAFSTTEWMKVTINGEAYEIAVTDEVTKKERTQVSGTYSVTADTTLYDITLTGDTVTMS